MLACPHTLHRPLLLLLLLLLFPLYAPALALATNEVVASTTPTPPHHLPQPPTCKCCPVTLATGFAFLNNCCRLQRILFPCRCPCPCPCPCPASSAPLLVHFNWRGDLSDSFVWVALRVPGLAPLLPLHLCIVLLLLPLLPRVCRKPALY